MKVPKLISNCFMLYAFPEKEPKLSGRGDQSNYNKFRNKLSKKINRVWKTFFFLNGEQFYWNWACNGTRFSKSKF